MFTPSRVLATKPNASEEPSWKLTTRSIDAAKRRREKKVCVLFLSRAAVIPHSGRTQGLAKQQTGQAVWLDEY